MLKRRKANPPSNDFKMAVVTVLDFKMAAVTVLKKNRRPMSVNEIAHQIIERGLVTFIRKNAAELDAKHNPADE